jgi:hypothetical protein
VNDAEMDLGGRHMDADHMVLDAQYVLSYSEKSTPLINQAEPNGLIRDKTAQETDRTYWLQNTRV